MLSDRPRPISKRVEEIFSTYYLEKSKSKETFIRKNAALAVDELEKKGLGNNFDAYIDDYLISSLVDSYFLDVIRYKEYHFNNNDIGADDKKWVVRIHSKRIAQNKAASLSSKWILKYKPIQIHPVRGYSNQITLKERSIILKSNSFLAIHCAMMMLDINPGENPKLKRF